jgi:hypothetical protein
VLEALSSDQTALKAVEGPPALVREENGYLVRQPAAVKTIGGS